jgi:hypothetical protein
LSKIKAEKDYKSQEKKLKHQIMKKERKYDLIFIIIAAGLVLLIDETGYADLMKKYNLVFLVLTYFIGKGIGKGVKEREWRESSDSEGEGNNQAN